jgi:hypothetical protein
LLIGGLPAGNPAQADGMDSPYVDLPDHQLPRGAVTLPDIPPHPSQLEALDLMRQHRRVALVAGRRWGKTSLLTMLAVNGPLSGKSVGVFCPTYKFLGPLFEPIVSALRALPGVRVNRMLGEVRLPGFGAIDLWSLDHTARAGRGRRYHLALIDESAHDEGRPPGSRSRPVSLAKIARSLAVKASPMAAMSKIRQASQLSPPNAAPKRCSSLRARRMVTKGVMAVHRRRWPLAAVPAADAGSEAATAPRPSWDFSAAVAVR